jgi:hypothetical protein
MKLRENDKILMEVIQSIGLTTNELRLVNYWRIFFQVNTLVELCNPMVCLHFPAGFRYYSGRRRNFRQF